MRIDSYKLDKTVLFVVLLLVILGLIMVFSASSFKAQEMHGDSDYFLKNHFYKVLAGLVLMLAAAKIKYQFWLKFSPAFLLICLGLLMFLLLSPSVEVIRGSKRWFWWGPIKFQPADFARIALILFISATSSRLIFKKMAQGKALGLNLAVITAIVLPIVMQPDVGTAALITFTALALVFLAGEKLRYLLLPALGAVSAFMTILIYFGYQKHRVLQYLAALRGEDFSWQTKQAAIALGNGGILGMGLGSGRQKYHFLPDPFTDFIYAIIGEELGILGTVTILVLFLILIWRGFKVAMSAPDPAGQLLGIGIVLSIAVYAFANAAVVVNLLPTTGIPMPFLSYGGSALITNLFGVGILLNISVQTANKRRLYPVRNALSLRPLSTGKKKRNLFGL